MPEEVGLNTEAEGARKTPLPLRACERILLIKLDGIGDFILLTPFLRGLRQAAPHAQIDLLVVPWALPFAELCPYVDRAIGIELGQGTDAAGKPCLTLSTWGDPTECQGFLADYFQRRYDLAVVPRWDRDDRGAAFLCRETQAARRVGFSRPLLSSHVPDYTEHFTEVIDRPFAAHDVEHNLALLAYLKGEQRPGRDGGYVEPATEPVELWLNAQDMTIANQIMKGMKFREATPLLVVCPGASGARREMPAWKLRDILKRVEDLVPGVQFLVVGRVSEKKTAAVLCRELARCREVCGAVSLRETAALIASATLVVTMDSGPAHMAAATDTPVVVLSPHPLGGDAIDDHSPVRFRPGTSGEYAVVQPEYAVWPCSDRCRGDGPNCIVAISDEAAAQTVFRLTQQALQAAQDTGTVEEFALAV